MARGLRKWSKTAASNATADSGINWSEGQAPSSINDSSRAEMASASMWRDDNSGALVGTLSTATYSVTSNQTFDALAAGDTIAIKIDTAMPATALLNLDALGAKPLRPSAGVDFVGSEYPASSIIQATYATSNSGEWIVNGAAALVVHALAAESGISTSDELPVYSASDSANKKVTVANLLKNVTGLTEDTSPDGAADFLLSYDTSASAAKKVKPASLPVVLPRGYIDGCTVSNGTDATNDIDITAGVCRDSTNTVNLTVPAIAGKQLDANWAAGGSAGMRNSAVGIANGTYHIWAVRTAASETADIYAHTSTAAATVLTALQAESGGSSYVYARHIFSIVRTSGAILPFHQYGELVMLDTPVLDVNFATPNTTANTGTLSSVPTGIVMRVLVNVGMNDGGVYLSSLDAVDLGANGDGAAAPLATIFDNANYNSGMAIVVCNTSAQIRVRASANRQTSVCTLGWYHPRGRVA